MTKLRSTKLPQIRLVGPPQAAAKSIADTSNFVWIAQLGVAFTPHRDDGKTWRESGTHGLRVLLHDPRATAQIDVDNVGRKNFHRPEMLALLARPYPPPSLNSTAIGPDADRDKSQRYLRFPASDASGYWLTPDQESKDQPLFGPLIVAPQAAWPGESEEVDDDDIEVPPLRLLEGRLRVLIDGGYPPSNQENDDKTPVYGLLWIEPFAKGHPLNKTWVKAFSATDHPRIEFPRVCPGGPEADNRFVAIELTPEGVEFEATIANPAREFFGSAGRKERAAGRFRLVNRVDPENPAEDLWSLELVDSATTITDQSFADVVEEVRQVLREINARVSDPDKRLFLSLNAERRVPRISWPLSPYLAGGTRTTRVFLPKIDTYTSIFRVDPSDARTRLLGDPVALGSLPTVIEFAPQLIEVRAGNGKADIRVVSDRRTPLGADAVTLRYGWKSDKSTGPQILPLVGGVIEWGLDDGALSDELVTRYRSAGVHPEDARATYAFVPIKDGWLQLPVPVKTKSDEARRLIEMKESPEFDRPLSIAIPNVDKKLTGRRAELTGASKITAQAAFNNGVLQAVDIDCLGATGRISGVLWLSTASPSAENVLPGFAAGSVSLTSPMLAFGKKNDGRSLTSTPYDPAKSFELKFGKSEELKGYPTIYWKRSDALPIVTAMPFTRTSEGSGRPSELRDLVPFLVTTGTSDDRPIVLTTEAGDAIPEIKVKTKIMFERIPALPLTLPGIEFEIKDEPLTTWKTLLRFDLPALDELFASTKLPIRGPADGKDGSGAKAPPIETTTSLEPTKLREAWVRAADRLDLSRVQARVALAAGPWDRKPAKVESLFEPGSWSTNFKVETTVQVAGGTHAFGAYSLDGETFHTNTALGGLDAQFNFDPNDERILRKSSSGEIKVTGFAAAGVKSKIGVEAAWRDSRGLVTAAMPVRSSKRVKSGGKEDGELHLRAMQSKVAADPSTHWATLSSPIEITPPAGAESRTLGIWFRDLPIKLGADEAFTFDGTRTQERALGPSHSAFDVEHLAAALYEWRFCNDAPSESSNYEVAIGPFQFRPLRLLGFSLAAPENTETLVPANARVLGTLSLPGAENARALAANAQANGKDEGPFGVDRAYDSGNLIAITLKPGGKSLTFAAAGWKRWAVMDSKLSEAEDKLSFRFSQLPVLFEEADGQIEKPLGEPTTARLEVKFAPTASNDGVPTLREATLETILFGRRVLFSNGTFDLSTMAVSFEAPAADKTLPPTSGIKLSRVTFERADDQWRMKVHGILEIVAGDLDKDKKVTDGKPLIKYRLGGGISWLNATFEEMKDLVIDHRRGVVSLATEVVTADDLEPISGLPVGAKASQVAELLLSTLDEDGNVSGGADAFLFRSHAGYGRFRAWGTDGAAREVRHVVRGKAYKQTDPIDGVWQSELVVDLRLVSQASRITWPVGALPKKLQEVDDKDDTNAVGIWGQLISNLKLTNPRLTADLPADYENLARRIDGGRRLKGKFALTADTPALKHSLSLTALGVKIPVANLRIEQRVSLQSPLTFHALCRHTVASTAPTKDSLSWSTIDQVTAVDGADFVDSLYPKKQDPGNLDPKNKGDYAFAPHNKKLDYGGNAEDAYAKRAMLKDGVAWRAFAQAGFPVEAMARHLRGAKVNNNVHGIVVVGAGPSVIATTKNPNQAFGVGLALPWLTATKENFDFDGGKLSSFNQASPTEAEWWAPDIDWAAGSIGDASTAEPFQATMRSGSVQEITDAIAGTVGIPVDETTLRALTAVEQVFLRGPPNAPISEQPLWLRSLVALHTVWRTRAEPSKAVELTAISIVPLGLANGRCARIAVYDIVHGAKQKLSQEGNKATKQRSLVVLSRSATVVRSFTDLEWRGDANARARLIARANSEMLDPVGLLVDSTEELTVIDLPPDLDDGRNSIKALGSAADRLYASPALGWPTRVGLREASKGALGCGFDLPFRDDGVPKAGSGGQGKSVGSYGSGLSGRKNSVSLPLAAYPGSGPEISTRKAAFFTLRRTMLFERASNLPLVSPPVTPLSPHNTRLRAPVAAKLQEALRRVTAGTAAPLVPPRLTRFDLGLRPGSMQATFEQMVYSEDSDGQDAKIDKDFDRFGRPAHGAPVVTKQHRSPRAPPFPRVPIKWVESHGRRTFVALDQLVKGAGDDRFAAPFVWTAGVANIVRRFPNAAKKIGAAQSFQLKLGSLPLTADWAVQAEGAKLPIQVTSPSLSGDSLVEALVDLGLLRRGLTAVLSVDRVAFRFTTATWESSPDGSVSLVLQMPNEATRLVAPMLDLADGDTEVLLQMRCLQETAGAQRPEKTFELSSATPVEGAGLEAETRRAISFRVPVRSTYRPSLAVEHSTLIFADPAYDRELSGPGQFTIRRDDKGDAYKLAADRFEYGSDTPVYFAFGKIDEEGVFLKKGDATLKLLRLTAPKNSQSQQIPLHIAGLTGDTYAIKGGEAYGLTLSDLGSVHHGTFVPEKFEDGDELVLSVTSGNQQLSLRLRVVDRPVTAPPCAIYGLVLTHTNSPPTARVALHSTGPYPQTIEFPSLIEDLATGHVRRRALFVWPTSEPVGGISGDRAALVKIDRAGGAQLPSLESDIVTRGEGWD